jgi:hypothetical protein
MAYEALAKRTIKAIKLVVEFEVTQINENGTFSKVVVTKATTSNKDAGVAVSIPPMKGGAIYLKATNPDGLSFLEGPSAAKAAPKKFF